MKHALIIAGALSLSACGGEGDRPADESQSVTSQSEQAYLWDDVSAVTASDGILVEGRPMLRFGSPRDVVEQSLTLAFNVEPDKSSNAECGGGATEFSQFGPLQVSFQNDRFVGWFLSEGEGVSTMDNIAPGRTTLSALKDMYQTEELDTSLDGEFQYVAGDYGTIGGFASGNTITSLHAGMTCFFR